MSKREVIGEVSCGSSVICDLVHEDKRQQRVNSGARRNGNKEKPEADPVNSRTNRKKEFASRGSSNSQHDLYVCVEEMRTVLLKTDVPKDLSDEELDLFSSILDAAFVSHASAQGVQFGTQSRGMTPSNSAKDLGGSGDSNKSLGNPAVVEVGGGGGAPGSAVRKGTELFVEAFKAGGSKLSPIDQDPQTKQIAHILQMINKLESARRARLTCSSASTTDAESAEPISEERQILYKSLGRFRRIAQRVSRVQSAVSAIRRMSMRRSKATPASDPSDPPPSSASAYDGRKGRRISPGATDEAGAGRKAAGGSSDQDEDRGDEEDPEGSATPREDSEDEEVKRIRDHDEDSCEEDDDEDDCSEEWETEEEEHSSNGSSSDDYCS